MLLSETTLPLSLSILKRSLYLKQSCDLLALNYETKHKSKHKCKNTNSIGKKESKEVPEFTRGLGVLESDPVDEPE